MFKTNKSILFLPIVVVLVIFGIDINLADAQTLQSIKFQTASAPTCTQASNAGTFYFDGTNYKMCTGVAGYKNVLNEAATLTDAQIPDTITASNYYLATNPSGYITNDSSVAKGDLANSGTLGFTWSDAEVSDTLTASAFTGTVTDAQVPDTITASNYYLTTNPSGYITNDASVAKGDLANSGTLGFTWSDAEVSDTLTASVVPWGGVGSKPTTVSGFGITDFVSSNSGSSYLKDNATTNGHYYVTDVSLFGQTDGALYVQSYSSSWVGQIYQDYRTGQISLRGKNSGTWQAWRNVWDATNLTNLNQLTNGPGYITNDASVPKGDLANSGTLGFTWSDAEVSDTLTASAFTGTVTDAQVPDTITASNYYLATNPSGYITAAQTSFSAATVTFGGGTGKIDAGTVDPIYTIRGKRYATYLPSATGVKEETTGVVDVRCQTSSVKCQATIDFNNLEEGSDLWLFSKATNLKQEGLANLTVLLTPSFSGRVWYNKDENSNQLTIFGDGAGEVSYRFSAPRFDWRNWSNNSTSSDVGFNLDKLIK